MDANYSTYAQAAAFIGAAIAMGIGSVGPAIGQGMIGKAACEAVGKNPESNSKMFLNAYGGLTSIIYVVIMIISKTSLMYLCR